MLFTSPVATRVLAIPTSTNLLTPPPPPVPLHDESDEEGDDEDHNEQPDGPKPPQPPAPSTAIIGNSLSSSSSSTLPKSTISITLTGLAASSSSTSSATSETSHIKQNTLSTSATSDTSQPSTPSSLSQSDNNETTSTSTSSALSTSSTPVYDQSSAATALPIGQPDSGLETKVGSSPLGTAGIILAAVFGFIALSTTIYLLCRLRRRRQKQDSPGSDSEKQYTYASTVQETGVIFGRRGSNARTSSSPSGRHEGRPRGTGRSRFSFLNRTWYSTGSQFSASQQQARHPQPNLNNTTTNSEPPTTPSYWPSPFFFTLGQHQNQNQNSIPIPIPRLSSRTNSQYYPSTAPPNHPPPQTPQTATTITRLTTDIQRNISTRTTDSDTSQAGSGHARAYAHHGIRAPHSVVINAARTTISSISSRWTRTRQRSSRVDVSPRLRDTNAENIGSPVSEGSDLYHGDSDRSSRFFPPQKHRLSNSTAGDLPIRTQTVECSRWSSSDSDLESTLR